MSLENIPASVTCGRAKMSPLLLVLTAGAIMNFQIKEKLILWMSGVKIDLFNAISWWKNNLSLAFTKFA